MVWTYLTVIYIIKTFFMKRMPTIVNMKKAQFWDKPKHNCKIHFWFKICLDFVCRGLVKQAKTRSNKFEAPLFWQNGLNSVGLYTDKSFSWPAYCKYAFCTFCTSPIISSPENIIYFEKRQLIASQVAHGTKLCILTRVSILLKYVRLLLNYDNKYLYSTFVEAYFIPFLGRTEEMS